MFRSASRFAYAVSLAMLLAALGGGCGSGRAFSSAPAGPLPSTPTEPGANVSSADDYFTLATEASGGKLVRWTRALVPVYADTANTPENWREEHLTFLQEAMDAWSAGAGGRVAFTLIPEPVDPCVKVRWVKENPMGLAQAGAVSQLDSARLGGRTYFTSVRIEVRTTGAGGVPETNLLMRVFSAHELGHALGIWGHSDSANDVLYFSPAGATVPSARDLATLARVYSATPEITEIPARSRVRGEPLLTLP